MICLLKHSNCRIWIESQPFVIWQRWSSAVRSSLFAADARAAKEVVAVVNPDLDFDHLFCNIDEHQKIFRQRGVSVDLPVLMKRWQIWEVLGHRLHTQKSTKTPVSAEETKALKMSFEAEATFMYDALALPNWLLPKRATEDDKVIHQFQAVPAFSKHPRSHIELGMKHQQFFSASTGSLYSTGQAADFELLAQRRFSEQFLAMRYEPLSCPDLFKPVVVEGSGMDLDDPTLLRLTSDVKDPLDVKTLRLCGSASLPAMAAYFTRVKFRSGDLPRSYYSVGRLYQRSIGTLHWGGLYQSNQSAALAYLSLMMEKPDLEFDLITEHLKNMLMQIGMHFQVVETGAKYLAKEESRRRRFEMWSVTYNRYVPVAFVSVLDDYVSRRLICCYDDLDIVDSRHYINMVHGCINVTHLLAAVMENSQDADHDWHIPEFFTKLS